MSDRIFVAALALICGISAFIGVAAPLGSYAHDTFFFLDNAYRVLQGQIPHRDFSSAWGPIIYLIDASGLALSKLSPTGIGYANALFGALIATWVFLITRSRWSVVSACALGIYTILLIAAPFPLGDSALDFGYAMSYNRYGYALFGVILIECASDLLPTRAGIRPDDRGAISTGVALGLLLFLKISYAIVAVLFIALSLLGGRAYRTRRLIALSGGFAALSLLVLCYLRFDLSDMVRDLAMAARARRLALEPSSLMHPLILLQNIPLALLVLAICRGKMGLFCERRERTWGVLLVIITILAGCLLLVSNQQPSAFPLNGYTAVVLVAAAGVPHQDGESLKWVRGPMAWLLVLCLLPICEESVVSLFGAAFERYRPTRPHVQALAAPARGAPLLFSPVIGEWKLEISGAEYVDAVNDGLNLLRRHSGSRDGVLTFDMFNPFNYLLDRPSPSGGFAAAAYNYIFCDAAHPTPERFFGDARYVLVRKYKPPAADRPPQDGYTVGLTSIYGAALQANFEDLEETEHWVLWRRRH